MRKLRFGFSRCVSLILCAAMLDAGLAGSLSASPSAGVALKPAGYDGETLFRGLFFGTGPVAALFPEIWNDPGIVGYVEKMRSSPDTAPLIDRIVQRVNADDAGFFPRLASELQSGDHVRVQQMLDEASSTLMQAAREETGVDPSGTDLAGPHQEGFSLVAAVVVVAAVAVVAVVVAAVLIFADSKSLHRPTQGGSPLENDVVVDLVATRLALSPAK